MTRQAILLMAVILQSGCGAFPSQDIGGTSGSTFRLENDRNLMDTHTDSSHLEDQFEKKTKDLSGFAGYAWGASYGFILESMEDENYDLLARGPRDLWYSGRILDEPLQIVYLFDDQLLTSGMWVIDDVDQEAYRIVSNYLSNAYNFKARTTIRDDGLIESEMMPPGTDALIIHSMDVEHNDHVVHYYFKPGTE
jgi:hypothetical protein